MVWLLSGTVTKWHGLKGIGGDGYLDGQDKGTITMVKK